MITEKKREIVKVELGRFSDKYRDAFGIEFDTVNVYKDTCLKGKDLKKILGRGSYGTVRCLDDDDRCKLAVKYMRTDNAKNEIENLKRMNKLKIGPIYINSWECTQKDIIYGKYNDDESESEYVQGTAIDNYNDEIHQENKNIKDIDKTKEIMDLEEGDVVDILDKDHDSDFFFCRNQHYVTGWCPRTHIKVDKGTITLMVTEKWDDSLKTNYDINSKILEKLCREIETVHKNGYIHGDIARRNILVKINNQKSITNITLSDFGFLDTIDNWKKSSDRLLKAYKYQKNMFEDYYTKNNIQLEDVKKDPTHLDKGLIWELWNQKIGGNKKQHKRKKSKKTSKRIEKH